MIIDTSTTIAYKCSSCGTFKFASISLFELSNNKETFFKCNCNGSTLVLSRENPMVYKIVIPCIGCGVNHVHFLDRKEIMSVGTKILNCSHTGMVQCFIGSDYEVRKQVDQLEKELDDIINMFGYDSYFTNTRVMYDSLNMVHDIAEKGNLLCECGNKDIDLLLLCDKIYLKCKKCNAYALIYASTNEHLKENTQRKQIILTLVDQVTWNKKIEPLIRKTDGK